MMTKGKKKKAMFCMMLLVVLTLLSFFDIDCQVPSLAEDAGTIAPETVAGNLLENDSGILPDYLGIEEIRTAGNVTWICQYAAKRTGSGRLDFAYSVVPCFYAWCIGVIVFLFYSIRTDNRSLKFIICYIHDTDGQKD